MATQWDIVSRAVAGPRAAFQELIRQAAQAPLLHRDDTPMKVLSLMAERARAEADGGKPVAKAINTSGIVAVLEPHKVVQRCDALASNIAGEFDSVLANCLTHGRR